MNYAEVYAAAYGYADRSDTETTSQTANFLRIVEARVNKRLKTQEQGSKNSTPCVAGQVEYALPSDFAGLRDIKVVENDRKKTLIFVTPEKMDAIEDSQHGIAIDTASSAGYYTIVANQIQIYPAQNTGASLDIIYYKKVPELTDTAPDDTNWLSESHPDCYVFGLLVEINAFVKDADAKALWDDRFKEAMLDIHLDDQRSRWSGPPMQMRTE